MLLSQTGVRISKSTPKGSDNRSTGYLLQGGFIRQEVAGVYSYLPFGLKILDSIKEIVHKHLSQTGAQQIAMPAIGSREHWKQAGRSEMDILFKVAFDDEKYEFLNPTHEEVIVPLAQEFVSSYKHLPFARYQTQTKFRKELRAKSGLLRGKEFLMNDMYSFHVNEENLHTFYEQVKSTYRDIFDALGLGDSTYLTYASGGDFSKFSHEFQTVLDVGEDTIYLDKQAGIAINKEIYGQPEVMEQFKDYTFTPVEASESANIFKLGNKFTKPFNMTYTGSDGQQHYPVMGCYGIGISRLMGIIAEKFCDDKGLIWPDTISPYDVHLIVLGETQENNQLNDLMHRLDTLGKSYLIDDTPEGFGSKMSTFELLGIPLGIIISSKTAQTGNYECKNRHTGQTYYYTLKQLEELVSE